MRTDDLFAMPTHTEQIEPIYDQPITHFGASFYYIDGLLTVYFITENQEIKKQNRKSFMLVC